jgi:NADH-quinone oxidoreductase subunit C
MPDQEQAEGAAEGEPPDKAEGAPEGEQAGGDKAEQPAPTERKAAAKAPAREPPPPGGVADLLAEALPDVKLDAYQGLGGVIIEVERDDIPKVMPVAKDDPRLDFKFLRCVFGVDLQEEGLEVVYQLLSLQKGHEVTIKARVPQDDPRVASVTSVWKGANWHERETRDMFGITFDGHPHLVPLLLPEDMTDHFPLRKDNPLAEIEEWQGVRAGEGAGAGEEEGDEE